MALRAEGAVIGLALVCQQLGRQRLAQNVAQHHVFEVEQACWLGPAAGGTRWISWLCSFRVGEEQGYEGSRALQVGDVAVQGLCVPAQ